MKRIIVIIAAIKKITIGYINEKSKMYNEKLTVYKKDIENLVCIIKNLNMFKYND